MTKYIKTNSIKFSISRYLPNASIAGAIWRSHEIIAINKTTLLRPALDLGCGNGIFAQTIFQDKLDFGLDISKEIVESAKKNRAYYKYIVADAHNIPLPNQSVQTVFSNSVFEHIPNLQEVLSEISRILKPGGQVIFTTHSPNSKKFYGVRLLKKVHCKMLAKVYDRTFSHMLQLKTLWDLNTWVKNLSSAGMSIEEYKVIISPRSAFWFEFLLPFAYIQNRLPILKKIFITKLALFLIKPDYNYGGREGRNFFIAAKKERFR